MRPPNAATRRMRDSRSITARTPTLIVVRDGKTRQVWGAPNETVDAFRKRCIATGNMPQ